MKSQIGVSRLNFEFLIQYKGQPALGFLVKGVGRGEGEWQESVDRVGEVGKGGFERRRCFLVKVRAKVKA